MKMRCQSPKHFSIIIMFSQAGKGLICLVNVAVRGDYVCMIILLIKRLQS